jgi:hypothetical protein
MGIITLTKHPPKVDTAPAPKGDGAPKITDEMVEAGLEVYLRHCPDSGLGDSLDRRMIAEIMSAGLSSLPT